MTHTLLLVEDDDAIAEALASHLRDAGFALRRAREGEAALAAIGSRGFDLMLLDQTLPDVDGLEVCRRVRARADYVPLIMLGARATETHRVLGLELGADDYLTLPLSPRELVARVRALLRRAERPRSPDGAPALRFGGYALDPLRRELRHGDAAVPLTLREFDLLYFLVRHPGRVFSRHELLARVWGTGFDGFDHTVNSHIHRLRSKLEADPAAPRWIETVWGVGYRFGGREPRA